MLGKKEWINTQSVVQNNFCPVLREQLESYENKGSIKVLNLEYMRPKLDDAGLLYIVDNFPNLTDLYFHWGTNVTGAGLAHLERLPNLINLNLGYTLITAADLEIVARLHNLTSLGLSNTKITDAGLQHVARMTNLINLSLSNTGITNADLEIVAMMTY